MDAIDAFDLSRGVKFETYCVPRIRGAMLDELRSRDWMPRVLRSRARRLARTRTRLQHVLGRAPSDQELALELEIDLETYWRWVEDSDPRVMLALDGTLGSHGETRLSDTIPDPGTGAPGDALVHRETLEDLMQAFDGLPARERLILSLYYYEELSLKQIGEVLHVSESRISQIRTRALRRLRARVSETEEAA